MFRQISSLDPDSRRDRAARALVRFSAGKLIINKKVDEPPPAFIMI